jgi:hypothetical protein
MPEVIQQRILLAGGLLMSSNKIPAGGQFAGISPINFDRPILN